MTHKLLINIIRIRTMKINFNQTLLINKYNSSNRSNNVYNNKAYNSGNAEYSALPNCNLAYYPNISFKMNEHMAFLLNNAKRFRCAYSGRPMILQNEAKLIYSKLGSRPNAQSAINFLQQYTGYMHDIESKVFDFFSETSHKNKKDFKDILLEEYPQALERLREKQTAILTSVNKVIEETSEPIACQLRALRDESLKKMKTNTFGRKTLLESVKKIKAKDEDLDKVIQIYRAWYKLPKPAKDFDAFVVKYSKKSHFDIAKRLISSAVATIEHIKPSARGGDDNMRNYILVSAQFNNERDTMPLWEYMMLNKELDIRKHLQQYMDTSIKQVQDKKSPFYNRSWYPESIHSAIYEETAKSVNLNTDNLNLSKTQKKENSSVERLGSRFILK